MNHELDSFCVID